MPRASRPWFRFYVEAVADRKLRRERPEHRWLFVACLAAARESTEPGRLLVGGDRMVLDDLADYAGMARRQVEQGMTRLLAAGVLAEDARGWLVPAWEARQFESDDVTQRTRKHRSKEQPEERSNNEDRNAPDTEADTETEQQQGGTAPPEAPLAAAAAIEEPDDERPALTTAERNRRFAGACRIIAGRAAARPSSDDPEAVRRGVERTALREHHERGHQALQRDADMTAAELADWLEPPAPPKPAQPNVRDLYGEHHVDESIADLEPQPNERIPDEVSAEALERIAAIREQLHPSESSA